METTEDKEEPGQGSEKLSRKIFIPVLLLYAIDQVTKWYVVLNFAPPNERTQMVMDRVPVLSDNGVLRFDIIRIHNTGVAFGMANGQTWAPFVFLGIQVLALWGFIFFYKFFNTKLLKAAWAFGVAGVLGNMTDRLLQGFFVDGAGQMTFWEKLTNGYVVDFLDFYFPWMPSDPFPEGYHWPAFNVADSCICIAAALFIISALFFEKDPDDKEEEPSQNPN